MLYSKGVALSFGHPYGKHYRLKVYQKQNIEPAFLPREDFQMVIHTVTNAIFYPVAFSCTSFIITYTSPNNHRYCRGCNSAISLNYVSSQFTPYYMHVFSMQNIEAGCFCPSIHRTCFASDWLLYHNAYCDYVSSFLGYSTTTVTCSAPIASAISIPSDV